MTPLLRRSLLVAVTAVSCTQGSATASVDDAHVAQPRAQTYTATRFDDPAPDGCAVDDCSLREAVIAANGHPGADAIVLAEGTYTLDRVGSGEDFADTGDLDIRDSVTITGRSGQTEVSIAPDVDRVFHVHAIAGGTVALTGFSISGGRLPMAVPGACEAACAGGGVYVAA